MMSQVDPGTQSRLENELSLLKKYGLRWAVLAAWWDELLNRKVPTAPEIAKRLEASRIRISSGCFSGCEVGCDLQEIESLLTSADASMPAASINRWLKLLGRAMNDRTNVEELLKIPAVHFRYNDCQLRPCGCRQERSENGTKVG
ncbi:MAG: hypothetical protein V1798_10440 [Pseudomonadota bacterium]